MNRRQFTLGIACVAAVNTIAPGAWGGDTIRIVHSFSRQSPVHSHLNELVPAMEATADFSARFEVYAASELGTGHEPIFSVFDGRYDFLLGTGKLFAAHQIDVGPLGRSDLFKSLDQWKRFTGSEAEEEVALLFQKNNLHLMGSTWLGSEHLVSSKTIRSVADLKGMRVGMSWGSLEYAELFKALGAKPVKIRWPKVYGALERGDVDGSLQALAWTGTLRFSKKGKTIIRNPIGGHVGWLIGRADWRDKMDPFTAKLVQGAVSHAMVGLGQKLEELKEAKLLWLAGSGFKVAEFGANDMAVLRDTVREVREEWRRNLNLKDRRIAELIGGL